MAAVKASSLFSTSFHFVNDKFEVITIEPSSYFLLIIWKNKFACCSLNQTLSYTYNNDFLPTSSTYAGKIENYTYDNDNLVLSSGDYTFTRDTNNAYVTKVTDGKLIQDYTYDNYGELTKVSDNTFAYEITSKDNASLIKQKTETINNATNTYDYTYDDNARLVEVKKDNTTLETYSYDNNGNRLSATVNNITTTGSYTLDDQLEVYGNNTYRYDDDGYLEEKNTPDGTTTYSYSTLGELQQVVTPDKTITYLHNANNQRVAKLIDNVIVEKYLWKDLTTLLAIYDKDDNLVQRFEYANSRMPISMTSLGTKYYLHYDQVGSLRAVSDTNHNLIKEITYDTYGNIVSDSNTSFKVPFGFAGGLYDSDTGLNRFGYRDYDSYTGKWTAKDPIDFDGGDSNLYGYVLNDPVNGIDPWGLCDLDELAKRKKAEAEAMEKAIPSYELPEFDPTACKRSAGCTILKNVYKSWRDGVFIGDTADVYSNNFNTFSRAVPIISIGVGVIKGAREYHEYNKD